MRNWVFEIIFTKIIARFLSYLSALVKPDQKYGSCYNPFNQYPAGRFG
jgi:hypothetical protein